MQRGLLMLGLVLAVTLPAPAFAEEAGEVAPPQPSVEARFDRTGDAIVDAADWREMSEEEKLAYAQASLKAMGEDPASSMPDGRSKGEHYLQAIKAIYE